MNRKLTLLLIVMLGLMALAACGGGYVYVQAPPPAPRYGVIGVAPGPGYVWADGFWDWRGGTWFWVNGSWMRPPRRNAVWVPARWVPKGHGYRRVPGHWRK
jgi:WXXGXW repeat (2 copies)